MVLNLQQHLTAEELGRLVIALLDYSETGALPQGLGQLADMAFTFMAAYVDRDYKAYCKKIERSRKAANARWEKAHAAEEALAREGYSLP